MPEKPRCPYCHRTDRHDDRCPSLEAKPVDTRTTRDQTVKDWSSNLHIDSEIKPVQVGWKTPVPIEGEDKRRILGPDGRPFGMRSEIIREKSEIDQLWDRKRNEQPCCTCQHFDPKPDPVERQQWFVEAAHGVWPVEAMQTIFQNPKLYGLCMAREEWTHRDASCLRLYTPRRSWLQSIGGLMVGGSKKHGF